MTDLIQSLAIVKQAQFEYYCPYCHFPIKGLMSGFNVFKELHRHEAGCPFCLKRFEIVLFKEKGK